MTLFEFAETAEDSELHRWVHNVSTPEFDLLITKFSPNQAGLILWAEPDNVARNNMTFDEARMFMMFVALTTGEIVE